jgi:hypothetical protein
MEASPGHAIRQHSRGFKDTMRSRDYQLIPGWSFPPSLWFAAAQLDLENKQLAIQR